MSPPPEARPGNAVNDELAQQQVKDLNQAAAGFGRCALLSKPHSFSYCSSSATPMSCCYTSRTHPCYCRSHTAPFVAIFRQSNAAQLNAMMEKYQLEYSHSLPQVSCSKHGLSTHHVALLMTRLQRFGHRSCVQSFLCIALLRACFSRAVNGRYLHSKGLSR